MQLLILSAFTAVLGLAPKNPTLALVPEKLRVYQNVTAMSDETILSIFKKSLEGKASKFFYLQRKCLGVYDNSAPKFRYTGTVGSGTIHPVIFTKEIINIDAVINGGIFLCMKPGFYHFSGKF